MPVFAYFDHRVGSPSPVLGWIDTDAETYPVMPDPADLLELAEGQTFARFGGTWAVAFGTLVQYTPAPILTLAQQADQELARRLAAGIAITSDGNPALDATYALDSTSTGQIFQIGLFASQFDSFPSGESTILYPDVHGVMREFSVSEFVAFLRVVAPLVSALQTQAGVMKSGGSPAWPRQSAGLA